METNRREFLGLFAAAGAAMLGTWNIPDEPKTPAVKAAPIPEPKPKPIQASKILVDPTEVCYTTCKTQEIQNRAGEIIATVDYGYIEHPHVVDSITYTCKRCGLPEIELHTTRFSKVKA